VWRTSVGGAQGGWTGEPELEFFAVLVDAAEGWPRTGTARDDIRVPFAIVAHILSVIPNRAAVLGNAERIITGSV
jgi:hypothetical protein